MTKSGRYWQNDGYDLRFRILQLRQRLNPPHLVCSVSEIWSSGLVNETRSNSGGESNLGAILTYVLIQ
jgi:hypothetical protein